MVGLTTLYNSYSSILEPNYSIRDYRKIRTELTVISDELKKINSDYEFSGWIRLWHSEFEALITKTVSEDLDLKPIIKQSVDLIKSILRCSLPPFGVLDSSAVLGSDGRLYNSTSLLAFQSELPEEFRDRSPLDLFNPEIFTTKPAPLVQEMIRWLERQDSDVNPPEPDNLSFITSIGQTLESPLESLTDTKLLDDNLKIEKERLLARLRGHKIRQRVREDRKKENEEVFNNVEAEVYTLVQKEFARHSHALVQLAQEQKADTDKVDALIDDVMIRAKPLIKQVESNLAVLRTERKHIQQETELLADKVVEANTKLTVMKSDILILQQGLSDLNKKIDEKEKEREKDLLKTIAIVIACIALSVALQAAASAIAASAGAGGGAGAGAAGAAGAGASAAGAGAGSSIGAGSAVTAASKAGTGAVLTGASKAGTGMALAGTSSWGASIAPASEGWGVVARLTFRF